MTAIPVSSRLNVLALNSRVSTVFADTEICDSQNKRAIGLVLQLRPEPAQKVPVSKKRAFSAAYINEITSSNRAGSNDQTRWKYRAAVISFYEDGMSIEPPETL